MNDSYPVPNHLKLLTGKGLVVPIWKGKGDRRDCINYRRITVRVHTW